MDYPFDDALSRLVVRELVAAQEAGDDTRIANVVAMLADQLGNAIAMVARGDPGAVEALLTGAEGLVAEVATEKVPMIASVNEMARQARRGEAR